MTSYTVSTSAQLVATISKASSGDTILLASGTYSDILLRNIQTSGITITSADSNHPATITDLEIRNSSGLTFTDLNLTTRTANETRTFVVQESNDIHFDGVMVSGPSDVPITETMASPFTIRDSQNVSVTNSEFHHLWHGLGLRDTTDVVVSGNYFHDIRTDGIRGGGNSNLLIDGNLFTDFYPAEGDHGDAIQLWTTGITEVAHDIVITNNAIVRGDGSPIQGIFIRDTYDTLPFENLTIAGNLVIGGNHNGISIDGAVGGTITDNTVVGLDGHLSWIRTVMTQGFTVTGNTSTFFMTETSAKGLLSANETVTEPADRGAAILKSWLAAHTAFAGAWGSSTDVIATVGYAVDLDKAAPAPVPPIIPVIQLVSGTSDADRLKVVPGIDTRIEAGDGNDTLYGGATGHNVMLGGNGDDSYSVSNPNDIVIELAGEGSDTVVASIDYWLTDNVETLRLRSESGLTGGGNELDNRLVGSNGSDRLFGLDGDDFIQGVTGNDWISGGDGNDDLRGDAGDDIIYGDAGDDLLQGGEGSDVLYGGTGNDSLNGGAGSDVMTGGAGADSFQFRADSVDGSVDIITDFTPGEDKITFRAVDANINTAQDDAFKFIGQQSFNKTPGELRFEIVGSDVHVMGDTNGDAIADFTIVLQGLQTVSANNFIL